MPSFPFPDDLRSLQRELHAVRNELTALHAQLPPRPAGTEAFVDEDGVEHPATPAWTEEERQAVDALWARQRELAHAVTVHPFWSTLGADQIAARAALKHLDETADSDESADTSRS
ncbi:hypothetical protein ACFOSC_07145 [Streptantibioticus rubrisoli]|uniref:Uncharacterized protein n=1 Tax=Streptantibioticus rubrisoli TaxID=1387313 RepID=A0ABT1P6Y6_9ACTN|nr:hypothetical protein [Streptantibioticus rubrisoli]MCQ4041136.1 hypothetical protein [Streptantibioticus rubrisoli]